MAAYRDGSRVRLAAFLTLVSANAGLAPSGAGAFQGAARVPKYGLRAIAAYPHDPSAYTQGLVYVGGSLYESTGLHGDSTLRKVRLETGEVLARHRLDWRYFGEGITAWGGTLVQLTWRSQLGFVYDRASLALRRIFRYHGEGWGLTEDGRRLIMSDGSAVLRFLDPESLHETGRLQVLDGDTPVQGLNELEFVHGEVYANVWKTDWIVRISPQSGRVTGWIDARGLLSGHERAGAAELNGIAYDREGDRLFLTGKLWPKLFEVELVPKR